MQEQLDRSFTEATQASFVSRLDILYDQTPSLSNNELIVGIMRAVATAGNAHTRTYLLRHGNQLQRWPIRFYWFADGLYVVKALPKYADILGARVVSINGERPERLLVKMKDLVSGTDSWARYCNH
ncbi:hypothetical protein KFU94_42580 [Chloroflexi bacterium TSY]|nr:hypothetical protein [Chloroflexi bacterium TSY]